MSLLNIRCRWLANKIRIPFLFVLCAITFFDFLMLAHTIACVCYVRINHTTRRMIVYIYEGLVPHHLTLDAHLAAVDQRLHLNFVFYIVRFKNQ